MKQKWNIAKQFDFCYGHRVWSQTLNPQYSLDTRCVCRHLHGHQGSVIIHLEGNYLTHGMITDFKHLNWFKSFLDKVLDHKFIVDVSDPMIDMIIKDYKKYNWEEVDGTGAMVIREDFASQDIADVLEGFVLVDFVPTSENLAAWIHEIVSEKMKPLNVFVKSVEFFETPKSQSVYSVE